MFKNKTFYICSFLHNYNNKIIPNDVSKIVMNFIEDRKMRWQKNNKIKINETIKSLKKSYILTPYILNRYRVYNKFIYINLIKKSIKQNYINRYKNIMKICHKITYKHQKRPVIY